MKGKIIKGIAGFYYVHDGKKSVYECKAKGIFRNKKIKPLVGDNVEFTILDKVTYEGNIDHIADRKNELIRPAVSNVDQALVIFSVTEPDPNLNLLDRFLVMMGRQGIPVSICFNKVDLDDGTKASLLKNLYENAGYPVYLVSTYDSLGILEIRDMIKGKTTVLAGPSGVGKSSLTNMIQPDAQMETGIISRKIHRGKHTTRHSELFCVEADTYMTDTPGFSSIFVEHMREDELRFFYPEFEPWEEQCKFKGCVHMGEKVCGVKDAVAEGIIGKSRYDSYQLLYQELKEKRRY